MNIVSKAELREIEKYKQEFSGLPLVNCYNAATENYDEDCYQPFFRAKYGK